MAFCQIKRTFGCLATKKSTVVFCLLVSSLHSRRWSKIERELEGRTRGRKRARRSWCTVEGEFKSILFNVLARRQICRTRKKSRERTGNEREGGPQALVTSWNFAPNRLSGKLGCLITRKNWTQEVWTIYLWMQFICSAILQTNRNRLTFNNRINVQTQ